MRIRLSPERHAALRGGVQAWFFEEFDETLSDFRADNLIEWFLRELGPPVYNQGVRDAAGYVQEKLNDIEGDVFERETPA